MLRSRLTTAVAVSLVCAVSFSPLVAQSADSAKDVLKASSIAEFRAVLAAVNPGQTIELSPGSYEVTDGEIATSRAGEKGKYITINGNGAKLTFVGTAEQCFFIKNDYYQLKNLTIDANTSFVRGVRIEASHGVVDSVTVLNSGQESFKLRNDSQYWLIKDCTVMDAGKSNQYGEAYYCGDAEGNWAKKPVADQTGYITFLRCKAIRTLDDGFDFKEGTHHIKVIDCLVDFQSCTVNVPAGNFGIYTRTNDIQVINTVVKNNTQTHGVRIVKKDGQKIFEKDIPNDNGGFYIKASKRLVKLDGKYYGSNVEIKGAVAENMVKALYLSTYDSTKLYTDYKVTGCAGVMLPNTETGEVTAQELAPSVFVQMTWDGEGGAVY